MKIQENLEDLCQEDLFGSSKGRKAVYFSLVSPLDPNPDRKYQRYLHMKSHHDRLFVIDLEAAQNSLEFFQTANGSVFCYDTVPLEFLTKIINLKKRIRKVWKRRISRGGIVSHEKESMRPRTAEGNLLA